MRLTEAFPGAETPFNQPHLPSLQVCCQRTPSKPRAAKHNVCPDESQPSNHQALRIVKSNKVRENNENIREVYQAKVTPVSVACALAMCSLSTLSTSPLACIALNCGYLPPPYRLFCKPSQAKALHGAQFASSSWAGTLA